jgi:phthiocerol/phenolphthiocerol synthesis type-I polyketide synthase E
MTQEHTEQRFDVAIIGMSGQFPGARDLREFWSNLSGGVESIRRFTDEELLLRGVDAASLEDPSFVKAAPVLENADQFAAAFFGYAPREAELMDPQHRLFLEQAWAAIEDAGYAPRHLQNRVGVFAGMSLSSYLLFNLVNNPALDSREEAFQAMIGGDKDFLCTRLSYKLNLKGPSLTVQTGCSTSLVAAHFAVQGLLTYQCDLAITGGVSVGVPQRTGYYYQPGGIASPDGHCRPFDADAQGTVFGEGIGVLVLKRLEDALRDRDHIYAVVRGSAINNDGSSKIGFTAPGAEGQIDVISRALAAAGVPASSLGYIETHGTATALGDPVEVAALAQIFRQQAGRGNSCALGAVKSNIGHLDAAAGSAGLIKTVLMLKNRSLVPTLHFQEPNPKIDFSGTPFYVNTECRPWTCNEGPLRAGVSSFGIGGTNAHIVLEEGPAPPKPGPSRPFQIMCLSADTEHALNRATENLCRQLAENPAASLADTAYTLHTGREKFKLRRVLVASNAADAECALRELAPDRVFTRSAESAGRTVAFMFPGGGSQHAGMGAELYKNEPVFRREIDHCAELLKTKLGYDLRKLVYPSEKNAELSTQRLLRPSAGLPAIFSTEYALAKLFFSWGVRPACMIGHSLGEYTAACLSGVFSLADALGLVVFRGAMFETLAKGAMLSVALPENELGPLPEGVCIAAINAPGQCVLSGPVRAVEEMAQKLAASEVEHHRVHIDTAAHCSMVEPVMEQFRDFLARITFSAPAVPFVSNLSGDWITEQQATDPDYWVRHLRHTVRFADGIQCIAKDHEHVMLEIGPGRTLSSLARLQLREKGKLAFPAMRHPNDAASELLTTYNTLARMWSIGVEVDWNGFYQFEERNRISLPTYPFERQRYWIAPPAADAVRQGSISQNGSRQKAQAYAPVWKRTGLPVLTPPANAGELWILLADEFGLAGQISSMLAGSGEEVISVRAGAGYKMDGPALYSVDPASGQDFQRLFVDLEPRRKSAINVVHLWGLHDQGWPDTREAFHQAQQNGLYSLLNVARVLSKQKDAGAARIFVAANGVFQVSGGEDVLAHKSGLLAACTVIPQEYENLRCCVMDIACKDFSPPALQRAAAQILAEAANAQELLSVVAYRGLNRWVRDFERVAARNQQDVLQRAGRSPVYLITGGLGKLGLVLARHLAEKGPCRIVLTTRSDFPEKSKWSDSSAVRANGKETQERIAALNRLEEMGTEIIVARADVSDQAQMEQLFAKLEAKFGGVEGVIHMAGITGDKALRLVADLAPEDCQAQFRPKIDGCYVLRNVLERRPIQFCVLFSSTASFLGGPGMLAYTATSCVLDTFAANCRLEGRPWTSINWDGWISAEESHFLGDHATALDQHAVTHSEALRLFDAALASGLGQVVVSAGDISSRIDEWRSARSVQSEPADAPVHVRPALGTDYAPPRNPLEKKIAAIWAEVLGIEQIGVHDNLFELGGSSLIGLRIVARLKKELNIDIRVIALFEGPTVATLAQLIEAKSAPAKEEDYSGSRKRGELRRNALRKAGAAS